MEVIKYQEDQIMIDWGDLERRAREYEQQLTNPPGLADQIARTQAAWLKYWEAFKDRNREVHQARQIFNRIMDVKEN